MDGSNNYASTLRLKTSGMWLGPGIRRLSKPWIFAKLKHDDDDEILPFDSTENLSRDQAGRILEIYHLR